MGDSGLQVWGFNGQYFYAYYPERMGPMWNGYGIASDVPCDRNHYPTWLEFQRREAACWETRWKELLTIDPVTKQHISLSTTPEMVG